MSMRRFEGKTAFVTGGATGVGYATARRLAKEGARVVITGRRKDVGEAAAAELNGQGLQVEFLQGDVGDERSVAAMFAYVERTYGGVDILVNNAATFEPLAFLGSDMAQWRKVFDIIVNGTWQCT